MAQGLVIREAGKVTPMTRTIATILGCAALLIACDDKKAGGDTAASSASAKPATTAPATTTAAATTTATATATATTAEEKITPSAKPPFEAIVFKVTDKKNDKGWPAFKAYNHHEK
jgi:hypothetical protein